MTPTVITGGTVTNVVPDRSHVDVDVRAAEPDELVRVDAAMQRLATIVRRHATHRRRWAQPPADAGQRIG